MKNNILLIFIFYIFCCSANEDNEWWKTTQLYQIYPRSFMDSDGDGIGDIRGIVSKVSHLADIGVEAVWLSPVFESPMKDFGYDISNFTKIQEEYGTEEDLKMLLAEARKYGIRVLLDFVPNHTSDQCEWFKLSADKIPGYENFYVWHEGKPNPAGGRNLLPSNWISVFRGSAWTFHEGRGEYYLHQFLKEQPDLNFREPAVIEEMQNVLRYWLDIGVDGFRVDAIPHLVESDVDPETGFYLDEPLSELTNDSESYDYLEHTQTREREETWTNIFKWRETMDSYSNFQSTKIIVMEAFSELDIVMKYYGNSTQEGAHYPFNFEMIPLDDTANAVSLKNLVENYMSFVPEGRVPNWVVGNHDRRRLASRVGELADGIMMMNMLLPGVSVTYQGEEIGMVDQPLSWEDTIDPQGCLSGEELYNATSRDPQRTPFQWDNSKNAGFSTGNKTWLPVADNYQELNLFNQKIAPRSTYKLYKGLSKLRRSDVIKNGEMQIEALDNEVLAFSRFIRGGDSIVVVINTANIVKNVTTLNDKFGYLDKDLEVVVPSVRSNLHAGEYVHVNKLQLEPYESLVLKNGAMKLFNISLIALFACIITMIMQIMA